MFCKYCGNELKENAKFCPKCGKPTGGELAEKAQAVKNQVNQTVQEAKETIAHTSKDDIKKQVKTSVQAAKETMQHVDKQGVSLYGIRQGIKNIVTHPKEHKILFSVVAVLVVLIIGLKIFVFNDERFITQNSDKMMQVTVSMAKGGPAKVDDLPLDGTMEGTYKMLSSVQKNNPGGFAQLMTGGNSGGELEYTLNDVKIKKDSAVASYTLTGTTARGKSDSVEWNIIWTKDEKKGWVITDQEIVKDGQSLSMMKAFR